MTYHQAYVLRLGTSYQRVIQEFGTPIKPPAGDPVRQHKLPCIYYTYAGHPRGVFQLCFKNGRLEVLATRL